jgi:predicted enzyme related to lactoylglutathione lyase
MKQSFRRLLKMKKDIRNQHGAISWGELNTNNPKAAAAFYNKVFGWTSEESPMPDGSGTYTCFTNKEGEKVAGAMTCDKSPIQWGMYVTVDNVDDAVKACTEAGGEVVMEAFDCPEVGRMAYLKDPEGATFMVITYVSPM